MYVGPLKGTQFDLKQSTRFEALWVFPMNTHLLIKEKELKLQHLHDAQRSFTAYSEGIHYIFAHQSMGSFSRSLLICCGKLYQYSLNKEHC